MMKWVLVAVTMAAVMPAICLGAGLSIGFYSKTCPLAEELVERAVATAFAADPGVAPGLIRAHFHDCFVRGCDASVLIDPTPGNPSEKNAIPNRTLRGLEVIDAAKAAIEEVCPGVVSCADILAFASRDSASLSGNIFYQVPAGRRDGVISRSNEVRLPGPFDNATSLIAQFAAKNLTVDELVTLSGAHSIGIAHCGTFRRRIFVNGTTQIDPTLSLSYGELLQAKCTPSPSQDGTTSARLDLITADVLDNKYYVGLQNNLGLLISDHALTTQPDLNKEVNENAKSASRWVRKYKRASVKMGGIEVLTGNQGEIRRNCRVINSLPSLAVE